MRVQVRVRGEGEGGGGRVVGRPSWAGAPEFAVGVVKAR